MARQRFHRRLSRGRAVVVVGAWRRGYRRQGKEGPRLGESGAERARAGGDADQVEQVAVLAGRGVGPLPGDAWRREADEERAPAGAANVAGGPVAPVPAAVREVAPADFLGRARRERRRRRWRSWRAAGAHDGAGETGITDNSEEHGSTSLAAAGGNARSRPLSASRGRRDGGRCAKREPSPSGRGWALGGLAKKMAGPRPEGRGAGQGSGREGPARSPF